MSVKKTRVGISYATEPQTARDRQRSNEAHRYRAYISKTIVKKKGRGIDRTLRLVLSSSIFKVRPGSVFLYRVRPRAVFYIESVLSNKIYFLVPSVSRRCALLEPVGH